MCRMETRTVLKNTTRTHECFKLLRQKTSYSIKVYARKEYLLGFKKELNNKHGASLQLFQNLFEFFLFYADISWIIAIISSWKYCIAAS